MKHINASNKSSFTILVVDDEKLERDGIKLLIKRYEFNLNVLEAENGRRALEILKDNHVDILLTDIKMPYMNGIQLIHSARTIHPSIKIIIFSAYGEFEYAQKAIEYNVAHYLLKPIVFAEFERVLSHVIDLSAKEREVEIADSGLGEVNHRNEILHGATLKEKDLHEDKVINEILTIIHTEYMKDISIDFIAERVFLSPSYVSYIFKEQTGHNFVKYLTNYRLERSKELLSDTNMKIVDVSYNVGYQNSSYFCSLFKKHYGITPNEFRENGMLKKQEETHDS